MRTAIFPGLCLQKLTTREPDDSQIEVAIASLKAVLRLKNWQKSNLQEKTMLDKLQAIEDKYLDLEAKIVILISSLIKKNGRSVLKLMLS